MTNSTNTKKEKKSIFRKKFSPKESFSFFVCVTISWRVITLCHILDSNFTTIFLDLTIIVLGVIYARCYYKMMKEEEANKEDKNEVIE